MKRIIAFSAVFALLATGCSPDDSPVDASAVKTVKRNTLTVCTAMPYEPFEFSENGVNKGIDADLAAAIADDMGYKLDLQNVEWDGIFDTMTNGSCDMVASAVSITDERKENYLFSDGYFEVNQSLLVRQTDAGKYKGLATLGGRKIGVQSDTTGAAYAGMHAKSSKVVDYGDANEALDALSKGDVDAVLQDFPVNSYFARKTGQYKVVSTFTDVEREQYGFAMPKGSEGLQKAVDQSLARILDDGRYDTILSSYLGTPGL